MTRKIFVLSLLILTACSSAPTAPSGPVNKPTEPASTAAQVLPLVGTLKVYRYNLDNGLRLLVVPDRSSPTFSYETWFRVGSRDERVNYTGLAHLFEHMMFKGTKHHKEGEFDHILEKNGVEGENAFTSQDYTAYVQELPKDKLELIMSLETDRMVNLIVNDESFKTERKVVQNERLMRIENNPDGTMEQELFQLAFTTHPYHWPIIGYSEDLERMTAADAREFYITHYSPNHATVVIAGDVDPDQAFELAKKHYGSLKREESKPFVAAVEPPQTSPRRKQLALNIQLEKLLMGYHIPAVTSDEVPALDVLQAILNGGKSGRLNRALINTGIASSVYAYNQDGEDPTLFMIGASLQPKKKAVQAERAIMKEIERLSTQPVPAHELEKAKNIISFNFFATLDSNLERTRFLGLYETITPSFEHGLNRFRKIQNVSAEDVLNVTKKYLNPQGRTVITGVPK